ncbi:hypothetical protein OIU74_001285, partial [Salix koriyanagi]
MEMLRFLREKRVLIYLEIFFSLFFFFYFWCFDKSDGFVSEIPPFILTYTI